MRSALVLSVLALVIPVMAAADGWQGVLRLTHADGESFPPPNNGKYTAVDLDSFVHVVWSDDRDRNFEIYHKMRVNSTWSEDLRLTFDREASRRPVLAVDSAGRVHLVWNDLRDGNKEIYHRIWDDGTWHGETRVSDTDGDSFASAIVGVGLDVHLVYSEDVSGHLEIMYRSFDFLGWSSAEPLTDVLSGDRMVPTIAAGPDGEIHVAWWDTREDSAGGVKGKIYYRRRDEDWSAEELVSGPDADAMRPSIAVDDSGFVHIAWIDRRDVFEQIYYRRRGSGGWEDEQALTTGDDIHYHPSLAVSGNDLFLVYWATYQSDTNSEIFFMSRSGGIWSGSLRLTDDPAPSTLCCLVVGPNADLQVTWADERDGNMEIYYREYIHTVTGTGDEDEPDPPDLPAAALSLHTLPNPFSTEAYLELGIPGESRITLRIYDVRGRCVRRLADCTLGRGQHPFRWDGRDDRGRYVAPGCYIALARVGKRRITSKILYLR